MLDTLKRLFKIGSPEPSGDPIPFSYIHTTPEGDLTITVHSLNLNRMDKTLPCWLYETKGLMAFGQKELVFILKRESGEPEGTFPKDPILFFTYVLQLAKEGKIVDSYGITQLNAKGNTVCGKYFLLYSFLPYRIRALQTSTADVLLCHLLHDGEGEAVKVWGGNRILSRLGHAAMYYPFPEWNDRTRKPLPVREEIPLSLLTKVTKLRLTQATTYFEESETANDGLVTLRVPVAALPRIRSLINDMTEPQAFAIITGWETSATGCFVWWAGQKEAFAIIPPDGGNARISGNFVLLSLSFDGIDHVHRNEDGFLLLLTPPSYERVMQSIRDAKEITLSAQGNRFSIQYPD